MLASLHCQTVLRRVDLSSPDVLFEILVLILANCVPVAHVFDFQVVFEFTVCNLQQTEKFFDT